MEMAVTALTWVLLMAGAFFLLTGALGMVRLPDVFTRMHAAGMTDTMGAGLILAGLLVHTLAGGGDLAAVPVRLLLILGFLWFTSPIATHATAKAALSGGVRPFTLAGEGSGAREPAPGEVFSAGQSGEREGGATS
ncbi:MAG: monovalent cation/H(+) antiporter subunit G [Gemmatimonadetes bacterium]|nr:monovalent cation/H(+) antiporter subunit G [Gemmatimonadota bacterium]MYE69805.1 monovalent cation/H(+) antiporter subunit G [Gemmatimonadota bacterium]MYJ67381.1 monovalent cation/H(+) antiporter subunit G [Gemmatimonadota bacterium]